MNIGILLAFLVASSEASRDIFFSTKASKELSGLLKSLVLCLLAVPVMLILAISNGIAEIQPDFWLYVSLQASLLSLAIWFYMKALSIGSVAQSQPILALSTLLLVITNPLMTDEQIPLWGWIGVLLIVAGIYITQFPDSLRGHSFLSLLLFPFREIFTQAGVRFKLGVAVIYSVTANLDRLCMNAADGPTYLLINSVMMSVILGVVTIILARWGKVESSRLSSPKLWLKALPGGIINSLTVVLHITALSFTTVPYAIAVKRLSILLVSSWGFYVRKDHKPTWYRLLGIVFVVAGVAVIVLLG